MAMQKVITVNIDTRMPTGSKYQEHELKEVNKYLNEGYFVKDKFSTVNSSEIYINLTFILETPRPVTRAV